MGKTFWSGYRGIVCASFVLGMILLCGCSGEGQMVLERKGRPLDVATKPVGLLTLRISNQYKPGYQPDVMTIGFKPEGAGKPITLTANKPLRKEKDKYSEYLVSVDLAPGRYSVGDVAGNSSGFLVIGFFKFPIGASFELPANAVVYLGRISMVNRKRNEGEPRSGGVLPLVDQAASGFADGTFDVSISDDSGTDIPLFEQKYPELKKYVITANIMRR